jgi:hypothetical protein
MWRGIGASVGLLGAFFSSETVLAQKFSATLANIDLIR